MVDLGKKVYNSKKCQTLRDLSEKRVKCDRFPSEIIDHEPELPGQEVEVNTRRSTAA